jgi:hypothetical protein
MTRDEIVAKGVAAERASSRAFQRGDRTSPWLYKVKIRSGRRSVNREYQAWCIPHLKMLVVLDQAMNDETLTAVAISRVMKSQFRSVREDV